MKKERICYTKPSITEKEVAYIADAVRNGCNVIELRREIWSASSVMMRFKAVTRSLHSKKEDLFLHLKIKSLNSMTLETDGEIG
jgi:hypothetical protein